MSEIGTFLRSWLAYPFRSICTVGGEDAVFLQGENPWLGGRKREPRNGTPMIEVETYYDGNVTFDLWDVFANSVAGRFCDEGCVCFLRYHGTFGTMLGALALHIPILMPLARKESGDE